MRTILHRVDGIQRNLRTWMDRHTPGQRRAISAALGMVVVALLTVVAVLPRISSASEMNA